MKTLKIIIGLILLSTSIYAQEINEDDSTDIYRNYDNDLNVRDVIYRFDSGGVVWYWTELGIEGNTISLRFANLQHFKKYLRYLIKIAKYEGDVSPQDITEYYPQGHGEKLSVSKKPRYNEEVIYIDYKVPGRLYPYIGGMKKSLPEEIYNEIIN